jgi:hypothetical protein
MKHTYISTKAILKDWNSVYLLILFNFIAFGSRSRSAFPIRIRIRFQESLSNKDPCGSRSETLPGRQMLHCLRAPPHTQHDDNSEIFNSFTWNRCLKDSIPLGCPRNKQKLISVRTETNRNKICFEFVSVCFVKPKTTHFRFVSVFRTYIETTETNRTVS